jgi:hypothetical protein
MADNSTLNDFCGIFRGNQSFYVKHQAPFTEHEGKLKAAWTGFATDKKTKKFLPVTKELYREHLNGKDGLAIAPLTDIKDKRNVCFYAVIDIDAYGVNYKWLVRRLYELGFKFSAFLSKSGGLHIYFFFSEPEPGDKVIAALAKIVEVFGLGRLYTTDKGKSKVEIFPKQATYVPGDGKVNCLFLPFYNSANRGGCKNKMLTAEGTLLGIKKALPVIESMFTSVKEIEETLSKLPYNDAPFCIQMILLTGALTENSGRNELLFTAALYLRLKFGKEFNERELEAMNSCLEAPLAHKDINQIYKSATEKDWQIWGRCKKAPMCEYCDRKLCKQRTFGVGRDKNNYVSNVEFGKIIRVLAEEPYYLWDARLAGNEEYKQVRIDGEADLLNQKVVQKACIRYLNQTPTTIKMVAWETKVNECLAQLEEIKVSRETDTSSMSILRKYFFRYLTHRQTQNGQPYMITLGQVYHEKGSGKKKGAYYFEAEGFTKFLTVENFRWRELNMREQLLSYGCTDGEVKYTTPSGAVKIIKCWKRVEDNELLELDTFYEDVYEGDQDIIQRHKLQKEDAREGDDGSDAKF